MKIWKSGGSPIETKSPRGDNSPKNPGKRVHQNPGGNRCRNDLLPKRGKVNSTYPVYQRLLWWFVALILISQHNCSSERKSHYQVAGTTSKTEQKNLSSIHTSSTNESCNVFNGGENRTKKLTRPKMVLTTVSAYLGYLKILVCKATESETSKKSVNLKLNYTKISLDLIRTKGHCSINSKEWEDWQKVVLDSNGVQFAMEKMLNGNSKAYDTAGKLAEMEKTRELGELIERNEQHVPMSELLKWTPQVRGRKSHKAGGKQIRKSRNATEPIQAKACETGTEIKKNITERIEKPHLPGPRGRVLKRGSWRGKCNRGAHWTSPKRKEADQLHKCEAASRRLSNHCRKMIETVKSKDQDGKDCKKMGPTESGSRRLESPCLISPSISLVWESGKNASGRKIVELEEICENTSGWAQLTFANPAYPQWSGSVSTISANARETKNIDEKVKDFLLQRTKLWEGNKHNERTWILNYLESENWPRCSYRSESKEISTLRKTGIKMTKLQNGPTDLKSPFVCG